jgi:glyoxylase-like metal-dependent hydrolase (beta-lactamase superfamily II)
LSVGAWLRTVADVNPRVYTYTAGEPGLFVNAHLVEAPEGVIAIDAGLLVSDARALRARLDALAKPLLAVFVTHGHPDHFNGVAELLRGAGDVPVYATAEGARVIRDVADAKRAQWGPMYGDEWPAETVYPEALIGDGETIAIGGLQVRAHELGPCESPSEAVYLVSAEQGAPPVAFTGDLFYDGMHAYNADGLTGPWLDVLDRAGALLDGATRLHPGHGRPRGLEALDRQREYLLMLRETVRNLAGGADTLDEAARAELVRRMTRFAPAAGLAWLVGLSADAVARELAAEPQPAAA